MRNPARKEQDISSRRYDGNGKHPSSYSSSFISHISYGASTRAGLALRDGARVCALLDGRDYVTPDDIKYLAHDILRHRI
jgi:MoxR-like ATPase